jgi:hypothetical protein
MSLTVSINSVSLCLCGAQTGGLLKDLPQRQRVTEKIKRIGIMSLTVSINSVSLCLCG